MKYFESFLDNWFLPLCLAFVSGWFAVRQKFIFDEHKNMLQRIVHLESQQQVIDTKMNSMTDTQQEIKADVKEIVKLVTEIRIKQANKNPADREFLQS